MNSDLNVNKLWFGDCQNESLQRPSFHRSPPDIKCKFIHYISSYAETKITFLKQKPLVIMAIVCPIHVPLSLCGASLITSPDMSICCYTNQVKRQHTVSSILYEQWCRLTSAANVSFRVASALCEDLLKGMAGPLLASPSCSTPD